MKHLIPPPKPNPRPPETVAERYADSNFYRDQTNEELRIAAIQNWESAIHLQSELATIRHHELTYAEVKQRLDEIVADMDPDEYERVVLAPERETQEVLPTCRHIRETGRFCGSIALKGQKYCWFHGKHRTRRLKAARARRRGEHWHLNVPPLEDLAAVQVSLMKIIDAIDHNSIDSRQAGLALYALQQAGNNLRKAQDWEQSPFEMADEEDAALEPEDVQLELDLPEGVDLDTPPEVAFPPIAAAAENAPAGHFEVTALDVELAELQHSQGPESVRQRLRQLDAAEARRFRKKAEQLTHARRLILAASQNAARDGGWFQKQGEAPPPETAGGAKKPPETAKQAPDSGTAESGMG